MTAPRHSLPELLGFGVAWGTPRKLPKPALLPGRVVVLDIAFASEGGGSKNAFGKTTQRFIDALGDRLAGWIDHHDSEHHTLYAADRRFTLASKQQHGACPQMITPELVAAAGRVDTIVCHTDFDGLASAAKWILAGREPYPGCDADARAIDTRVGEPGPLAATLDRALRAQPRDEELRELCLRVLAAGGRPDDGRLPRLAQAAGQLAVREQQARRLAAGYRRLSGDLVIVDASASSAAYDKTLLLLLGQQQAAMAAVIDKDNVTFAAAFDSGIDFLARFGLSGGMPTLVSVNRRRLPAALQALGVDPQAAAKSLPNLT